jgi:hypothetical protein
MMNFSFILKDKKDLSNLKLKLKGKDPINLIQTDITFNNVVKLNDGEEMSKVIVGKGLKYDKNMKDDFILETRFAMKYQILSKNTALFAQIINEESQQSKLLKVELTSNKRNKRIYESRLDEIIAISNLVGAPFPKNSIKCCMGMPMSSKKKKIFRS